MPSSPRSPSIFHLKEPWDNLPNSIWIATTLQLSRNIEKFFFPGKLTDARKKQLMGHVVNELQRLPGIIDPVFVDAGEMNAAEKEFLAEHFFSLEEFQPMGLGEGFIFDKTGNFLVTINLRDHVQFHYLDTQGELEESWNNLLKIETALGSALHYSYTPKFGFLTSDPSQSGTGMRALAFVQPTALVHAGKIDEVLDRLTDDSLIVTGIQGSPNEIVGDVLVLQNAISLGVTEESIISLIQNTVTKLEIEENRAREKLKKENNADIKDRVSRAFGILQHSYQIEAVEAINALSLLKLGLDMGWCSGIGKELLNQLFLLSRRAHLSHKFGEKLLPEEVLHKRAEFIHKEIQSLKLNI